MQENTLGKKIKALRENLGLTQLQLASKLGVSSSTIGMYEQGRREPSSSMLSKICFELNTSTDYLIGFAKRDTQIETEVSEIIKEFTSSLQMKENLTFNGKPIGEDDVKKIITAIRVAATIAVPNNKT